MHRTDSPIPFELVNAISETSAWAKLPSHRRDTFELRLQQLWPDIVRPLHAVYGDRADFEAQLTHFVTVAARAYAERDASLRRLDDARIFEPDWYQRSDRVGYIAYVERFAGDLPGVINRLDYLEALNVNLLHLMPLLKPRSGENDGGYAVADYRAVDPRLGSLDDLRRLTRGLHRRDISLMIDLVFNHTSDDHEWARRAQAGEEPYQAYYWMFPDRTEPDVYDQTLREVFPEVKRGNFIFDQTSGKWVWSTFHNYQWDLNYRNPTVFGEMLDIMLFLANVGVDVLRLDAVAWIWKEKGTPCESGPQTHWLLQAFRALTRLAAPGLALVAEAILSPEDVVPYFGVGEAAGKECEMAYHNSLMVLLWSALAERNVRLATVSLQNLPPQPRQACWLTYVRCHDDIGWAITDHNAEQVGLNGFMHRSFLSDFYSGEFNGSFARGAVFQLNPDNLDRRISGTCASLAGLERAIEMQDRREVDLAIGRILLLHSFIMAYGGIPLLYMGDELGLLNDYGFEEVDEHVHDNRWLHRPQMDWRFAEARHDPTSIPGRIFAGVRRLIEARRRAFILHADTATRPVWVHNDRILAIMHSGSRGRLLIVGNVTEQLQTIPAFRLAELGFAGPLTDHLGQTEVAGWRDLTLEPYATRWLEARAAH